MNSKQIANEIKFTKKVVFLRDKIEDRISKACSELKNIYNLDNVNYTSETNNTITQVAMKYQLKFGVLKAIYFGTKIK